MPLDHHLRLLMVDLIKKRHRSIKKSPTTDKLNTQFHVGKLHHVSGTYRYQADDIETLKAVLGKEGIDPLSYSDAPGSREARGLQSSNEKLGALSLMKEPICLKAMDNKVKLNSHLMMPIPFAHIQINAPKVSTIEASQILLVENLETFLNLHRVKFSAMPEGVLCVWRGGPVARISTPNTEKTVESWSAAFNIPLSGFFDFDLAGLLLGAKIHFSYLVLPKLIEIDSLVGNAEAYEKQLEWFNQRQAQLTPFPLLAPYVKFLHEKRACYMQERTTAFAITHEFMYRGRANA